MDFNNIDFQNMTDEQAVTLCTELRKRLLEIVSKTGGHLASNLGDVELTVAIHRAFNTKEDRLVFDVGHQCYCHKILTGRDPLMDTLRSLNGISGYPKPSESIEDAFIAGHASNSVSVATGMAIARTLHGENYDVIALIGDGALTGGLAYEGLSNAGQSREKIIVILNDNGMSISRNVGGIAMYLARRRTKPQYLRFKKRYRLILNATAPGRVVYRFLHRIKTALKNAMYQSSLFEDLGFTYLGPVDGHDVGTLTRMLNYSKTLDGPVLLHVKTVKGKGYAPAEENPGKFHGVNPFNIETGIPLCETGTTFSDVFGEAICELARKDTDVCAITAAMKDGTGLDAFSKEFPSRYFDVGIAEGHAVTTAAGMAKQGLKPVFAVYSSFLQRGFDMLIHDVAIQNLHVVFCIDRAGIVGSDGETHQGIFDVAYLNLIPNMNVYAPASFSELRDMLAYALEDCDGPVAIRYSRGGEGKYQGGWSHQASDVIRSGGDLTIVTYGVMINEVLKAADMLSLENIETEVIKCNKLTPLAGEKILASLQKTGRVLVAEDVIETDCVGKRIEILAQEKHLQNLRFRLCNIGNRFLQHGSVEELRKFCGLDAASLAEAGKELCGR